MVNSLMFSILPSIAETTRMEDIPTSYGALTPLVEHYSHLHIKSESITDFLDSNVCKTTRDLLDIDTMVAPILNMLERQVELQHKAPPDDWNGDINLIDIQLSQLLKTAFFIKEYFKYDDKNDPDLIIMDDETKQKINESTFLSILLSMFSEIDEKKGFARLLYGVLVSDFISAGVEGKMLSLVKERIEKILLNLSNLCKALQHYIGEDCPDYEANMQFLMDIQNTYNPAAVVGGLSHTLISSVVDEMLVQPILQSLRLPFQRKVKEEQTTKLDNKKFIKLAEDLSTKYSKEIVPDLCRLYHIYFLCQVIALKTSAKNIDCELMFAKTLSNLRLLDAISSIISSIPVICRMQRTICTETLSEAILCGTNYGLLDKTIESMMRPSKKSTSEILKALADETEPILNENIKNIKVFFGDVSGAVSVLKNALMLSIFKIYQVEHLESIIQLASVLKNRSLLKKITTIYSFPFTLGVLTFGEPLIGTSGLSTSLSFLKMFGSNLNTDSVRLTINEIHRKYFPILGEMRSVEVCKTWMVFLFMFLVVLDVLLFMLVIWPIKFWS